MVIDVPDGLLEDAILGACISILREGTREWRGELGTPTPDLIVHQSYAGSHNIGAVLLHIGEAEAYWIHQVLAGEPEDKGLSATLLSAETEVGMGFWPVAPLEPLAFYLDKLDIIREHSLEILRKETNPERVCQAGEVSFTVRWILAHVIAHESHHGGQAVLLHVAQTLRRDA